ncbi:MAG: LLM class F420-dependent oxidoreductase, partial [Chloroflexi bacterium]|nr:LLM class F420-dependent oxidoreductase [Chloroflexota bacterium]
MDLGIATFLTDYSIDVAVLAKKIEELGFDSLWMPEHVFVPVKTESPWPGSPDGVIPRVYADIVDPFVALARASAVTSKIKLATGICLVPERNPLLLAKEVATLDMYSGGRFLFGIGAGWLKEETEIMGGNFSRRWTQTRESILAMKELWTKEEAEFHGKYYHFPAVKSYPKPARKPHPPIIVGGTARGVFKRVAAHADGWMPSHATVEMIRDGRAALDREAKTVGRDPASIEITAFGPELDLSLVDEFEAAGAERMVIRLTPLSGMEAL